MCSLSTKTVSENLKTSLRCPLKLCHIQRYVLECKIPRPCFLCIAKQYLNRTGLLSTEHFELDDVKLVGHRMQAAKLYQNQNMSMILNKNSRNAKSSCSCLIPKNKPAKSKVQRAKWNNDRSYDRVAEDNGDDKQIAGYPSCETEISWSPSCFTLIFSFAKVFPLQMVNDQRNYSGQLQPIANKEPEIEKNEELTPLVIQTQYLQ